jgi:hypothetical protein
VTKAEQIFQAALLGDRQKVAQLAPYTKAMLDMPDLSPEDEALLEQNAVSIAPAPEPEPEPAPTQSPGATPGREHDDVITAREGPEPVDDQGSQPHHEHDDVLTDELHVEHDRFGSTPETFRADFGFMFNSDEIVPDAYRIVLALKYKENWLEWEPETLWDSIRSDFGPLGDVTRGKIMALRTCLKTNTPWVDWDAFEHVSQAFNDGLVIFGMMQPPDIEEAAYTVTVMRRLGDWPFAAEVSAYMGAVCLDAGLVFAPDEWFPSAQYFIEKQTMAPKALIKTIAAAWEKLKGADFSDVVWNDDNPVDGQVRKLWSVRSYLDGRRLEPVEPGGDTLPQGESP